MFPHPGAERGGGAAAEVGVRGQPGGAGGLRRLLDGLRRPGRRPQGRLGAHEGRQRRGRRRPPPREPARASVAGSGN